MKVFHINFNQSIFLYVIVISMISIQAMGQSRIVRNINNDWQYLEKPYKSTEQANGDSAWTAIDLPYSWNTEDATDLVPGYRRNASWYKKELHFERLNEKRRYFLYFEGANIVTQVFVNGMRAGAHVGGYVGFEVEITKFLKTGDNDIMIRVDNSYNREIIPSQKSDFFIYGGINRDVWLKEVSNTYINDIKIQTPQVSEKSATTNVAISIDGELGKEYFLNLEAKNPEGETIYSAKEKVKSNKVELSFNLKNPILWDTKNPNLYTLKFSLSQNNRSVDATSERIGYRWFEFKEHGPFYLNGKRLLLRGTHRHEEHAGYGAAMPNEQQRKDMESIKKMGANFVRLGHYPQDPEVYKTCDELGILVWDELPWCRGGVGNEAWKNNTKRLLKEMIGQNYNHPSIIIWSLGNEIDWMPDFEKFSSADAMDIFLKELNDIAHKMDPNRKTAIRKYYDGADIVDVFSPSIWAGWYSGSYKSYGEVIKKEIAKYPHFLHMEYGGSSHLGRHSENPITGDGTTNPNEWEEPLIQVETVNVARNGDWSENYIVDLFDWYLQVSETNPNLTGNAQWAFKDFGTPLRPENDIPYINQKGVMDRSGNPKDAYYVFKSYWSDDPFVYIESHTWTERSGPEGKFRNVCVFSNEKEVELFHNGKSLGIKERDINQYPACGLNWDVNFTNGENELVAVSRATTGGSIADSLEVHYSFIQSGSPEKLSLSYEPLDNGNYLVTVMAIDKNGNRSLDYEERVYFQCLSGGETKKNMGTTTGSEAIAMANGQAYIEVKPKPGAENLVMTVLNQYFKGAFLEIPLKMDFLGEAPGK